MILKIIPILAYGQLNSKKKNKPHTEKINHTQKRLRGEVMEKVYVVSVNIKFEISEITLLNSVWKTLKDAEIEANKITNIYKSPEKRKAFQLLGNPIITVPIHLMQLQ